MAFSLLLIGNTLFGMETVSAFWKKYTQPAKPIPLSLSFKIEEEKCEVEATGQMIYTTMNFARIYAHSNPGNKFIGWLKIHQNSSDVWTIEDNNPLFIENKTDRDAAKQQLLAQATAFARERKVNHLKYYINPEEIRACEAQGGVAHYPAYYLMSKEAVCLYNLAHAKI